LTRVSRIGAEGIDDGKAQVAYDFADLVNELLHFANDDAAVGWRSFLEMYVEMQLCVHVHMNLINNGGR